MLEISKLLSTLLPANRISQLAWEERGSFQQDVKLISTIRVCSLSSSQHAGTVPFSLLEDRSCATSSPPRHLPISYHFCMVSHTQAAAAADLGHQCCYHHVIQHQTPSSSATPDVTEIWEVSSALQIKPTSSCQQTIAVRTRRLSCNTNPKLLWTLTRSVFSGGLLSSELLISFRNHSSEKGGFPEARSQSATLLQIPNRRNHRSQQTDHLLSFLKKYS